MLSVRRPVDRPEKGFFLSGKADNNIKSIFPATDSFDVAFICSAGLSGRLNR